MTNEPKTSSAHRAGLFGLLVSVLLATAVETVHRGLVPVPAPDAIVLLAVVYTAYVGGTVYGLAACVLLLGYSVMHYSAPGPLFSCSAEEMVRIGTMAIVAPVIVVMVGALKRRTARAREDLHERELLEAKLAEREQIHAELEDSRAEQRSIFNAVPAMIWFKDADGTILRANHRAAESIGLTVDEIVGRSTWDLYPEEAEKYQGDDETVVRTGRPMLGIIERYETPDGAEQWVRTDKIPFHDENGNVVGVIVFAVDITEQQKEQKALREAHEALNRRVQERAGELERLEGRLAKERSERRQAEAAVQHGEQRLRTLIDNTNAVIYMKGLDGRYLVANRRFERIFGLPPDGPIGKTDDELFEPDMAAGFRRNDEEVLEAGQAIEFEEVAPHLDGLHTYISLKFPLFDVDGKMTGVCGISTDITDRKRAEEATVARLRYEEGIAEVSRTLLASVTTGEALRDALRHLRDASGACRVYLFENFEDPQAGLCMRQTHEDCAEGVVPQIDNLSLQHLPYEPDLARWKTELSRGNPVQGLVETFPESERSVLQPQEIQSILVLPVWSAGRWFGFIGFDDTKTRRLWTDEDVSLLRTAAEMIGAFIARERAETELRRAKEAAESANDAKTRFLANISHEIRTPIMAMLGAAELVRRIESGVHPGDIILRNGRHLLNLINELLDLSRIESDKLSVNIGPCSLLDILGDVAAVVAPQHVEKPVEFAIRYETPVPLRIHTDRTRLAQALINLANNALKYTDHGRVLIRVSADRDGPEPRLTLQVEDTGRGIADEDLARIFEAFAQVGPHSGKAAEGVGLGLPIAKWIAEQLGGSLTAESTVGAGSTFTLKAATGSLDDTEWLNPTQATDLPAGSDGLKTPDVGTMPKVQGRVLLAEDADDAREMIAAALTRAGADVVAVADGHEAVEMHQRAEEPFDLVLLDIRMPVKDGLQVASELRAAGCRSAMIAMTASTTGAERDRILDAGFDDVWGKPISLEAIVVRSGAYLAAGADGPGRDSPAGSRPAGRTDGRDRRIADRLAAVSKEFIRSLPGRVRELRSAFDRGDLTAAHESLHRLVGTAGICGYDDVSRHAAQGLQRLHERNHEGAAAEIRSLEEKAASLAGTAAPETGRDGDDTGPH